jgi:hypothetical protein
VSLADFFSFVPFEVAVRVEPESGTSVPATLPDLVCAEAAAARATVAVDVSAVKEGATSLAAGAV